MQAFLNLDFKINKIIIAARSKEGRERERGERSGKPERREGVNKAEASEARRLGVEEGRRIDHVTNPSMYHLYTPRKKRLA